VLIPVTSSELPKLGIREIRDKFRHRHVPKMECGPKEHCNGIDRTKLDIMVPNGSMLVSATSLVVLGVVQQDPEYLLGWSTRQNCHKGPHTSMPEPYPSGEGMMDGKRSDSSTARQLPPRSAVVVDNRSIARSRSPTNISFDPEKSVRQKSEQRSSSSFVYVSVFYMWCNQLY
jgi:hypothetical protein